MTKEEILAYQAKERAFAETPIGKAFNRFKLAHSHYWQADNSDSISDRRLRELHGRAEAAERELRDLIEPLAERTEIASGDGRTGSHQEG